MKPQLFFVPLFVACLASCGNAEVDTRSRYSCELVNGSSYSMTIEMSTYEPEISAPFILKHGEKFSWRFVGSPHPFVFGFRGKPKIKVTFDDVRQITYLLDRSGRNPIHWESYTIRSYKNGVYGAVFTFTDADYDAAEEI